MVNTNTKAGALSPDTLAEIQKRGALIDRHGVADLLHCSTKTVNRMVARGELPMHRVGTGRVLRFKTVEVMGLVERVA